MRQFTGPISEVAIVGDSELVISLLRRSATPQSPGIVQLIHEAWEIMRSAPVKIQAYHVKRELNGVADWLSQIGRKGGRHRDLSDLLSMFREGD